jgi:hypothetical protein
MMNNTEIVDKIRELFATRPPGVLIEVHRMFRKLDENLRNNGELPEQWANARRPLIDRRMREVIYSNMKDNEEVGT